MKNRVIFLTSIIVICSLSFCLMMNSTNTDILYFGIPYGNYVELYIINLSIYACYCFLCFSRTDNFLIEYGLFLVVRNKSRKKILAKYLLTLLRDILLLEIVKIIAFVMVQYIVFHDASGNLINLLYDALVYVIVICIMVLLQVNIEIFINAPVALLVNICSYLLFSFLGSYIYSQCIETNQKMGVFLNSFFLTNYIMNVRVNGFTEWLHYSRIVIGLILAVILIGMYLFSLRIFSKKDLI